MGALVRRRLAGWVVSFAKSLAPYNSTTPAVSDLGKTRSMALLLGTKRARNSMGYSPFGGKACPWTLISVTARNASAVQRTVLPSLITW